MTFSTVRLIRSYRNLQDDFVISIIIASAHAVIQVGQPGMQRIKSLAKNVVYWPNIGAEFEGYVRVEDVLTAQQH